MLEELTSFKTPNDQIKMFELVKLFSLTSQNLRRLKQKMRRENTPCEFEICIISIQKLRTSLSSGKIEIVYDVFLKLEKEWEKLNEEIMKNNPKKFRLRNFFIKILKLIGIKVGK